jgi:hypothetical protein
VHLPKTGKWILFAVALNLFTCASAAAASGVVELRFPDPPDSRTSHPTEQPSFRIAKAASHLYLMTHAGDPAELFVRENENAIRDPMINHPSRYCSVFAAASETGPMVGRNWDNENVGSIIVSLTRPPGGYASIGVSRAVDVGFGENVALDEVASTDRGARLALAPFYVMDGINEHGIAVAIAGLGKETVAPKTGATPIFVTFLMRKILDRTRSVGEAVELVQSFVPFDLDPQSLDGHFLVADPSGASAILEYVGGQWKVIRTARPWQVLTTTPILGQTEGALRQKCWRYKSLSEALAAHETPLDWTAGMRMLRGVEQKGTTWAEVYSLTSREVYLSVFKERDIVYHLRLP